MPHFFRGRTLSMQMVDHLFIDVTLLKRPIVYLESGRPLQTTTAEGVDMESSFSGVRGKYNSFKMISDNKAKITVTTTLVS